MDFVQGSPFYLCAVGCGLVMFVYFKTISETAVEQVLSTAPTDEG